ncbi:uncharacterized protein BDZ99DRAFT_459116 [Mytilinidion resinicola]|uniref:Heterokaryon incompatibility domain-containing protein n=1 Tax=Mytilinidion resinicola TaxID=574789 RepID=A0A6A6Z248_9PEZI|nr:uncharacterized protein BDZ99DRAFT_459116 [Mytilinidion resinicola]KAF2815181.1 hypothetical protein BDZ99DRAFT_459116 [Mytilinidion resinicola]
MRSQQPYHYSRLEGADAIRLVVIQPSTDLAAPVQCSLLHASLVECEDDIVDHYVALSYVWGDQNNRRAIEVDRRTLNITASLDEALRHLRDHRNTL